MQLVQRTVFFQKQESNLLLKGVSYGRYKKEDSRPIPCF